MVIRPARTEDLEAITEIYNDSILNDVATFDTEPKSLISQREWFKTFGSRYPLLVGEIDGQVAGWACLKPWSDRLAYSGTVENSVYVDPKFQGKGLGKALLKESLEAGRPSNFITVIARITEGNAVSVKMHEAVGFKPIGVMRKAGVKFGRTLDVFLMQYFY